MNGWVGFQQQTLFDDVLMGAACQGPLFWWWSAGGCLRGGPMGGSAMPVGGVVSQRRASLFDGAVIEGWWQWAVGRWWYASGVWWCAKRSQRSFFGVRRFVGRPGAADGAQNE